MSASARPVRILVLQRESLVAAGVVSLSVSARVVEVLDYMESFGGIEYAVISETDPSASLGVEWADIVIFSKHKSPEALELAQIAKKLGVKSIYDIDDWIFSFPTYSGGRKDGRPEFTHEILDLVDVVTVANEKLLEKVSQFIPGISPILLPNGIWVERYWNEDPDRKEPTRPRVLFTNADFLKVRSSKERILTALHVFFMRHPDFVLDFFGDPFPEMFSLSFLHYTKRVPYQNYMLSIARVSYLFAIVPLGAQEDEEAVEFNACKNPFKYINYGTARIPGIYSDAYIYNSSVRHGSTGLLVKNGFEDWLEAMELLARDKLLRERIKENSHVDIKNRFHVRQSSRVLQEIIGGLVG
jgi:hypothetical protein